MPETPPLDPKEWRYVGSIPNVPTPGDEQQYSLLSHMRHLLTKDPTLQEIGLQGGLDIWLYRNSEKILEWSSAARDSWAGGQQVIDLGPHLGGRDRRCVAHRPPTDLMQTAQASLVNLPPACEGSWHYGGVFLLLCGG
jgi:hypothetical protein